MSSIPQHATPEQLARWMQEQQKALRSLAQVLREHIVALPAQDPAVWLDGLRRAFVRLHTHLGEHFAGQEHGGYLTHIVEVRPTLSTQLERSRHEHGELLKMAARIVNELEQTQPGDQLLIADLSARIQRFLAVVQQHEQRECMLSMFALNTDLGCGD